MTGSPINQRSTSPLWHPFANMGKDLDELVIDRGTGFYVYDEEGNRYIDATAGLFYANVGYGREEIADAVREQMGRIHTYSIFGSYANRQALELASRLVAMAPMDDAVVFFTSGGSDGVETSAKLARRYWVAIGRPEKRVLISRERSYHGMHGFGTGLAGIPANYEGIGEIVPDTVRVGHDDPVELEEAIGRHGPDRVAAFFAEPVIGAGGIIPPPDGYLEGCLEICRKNDVLFIADEVVTGFGRLGRWFGCDRFHIRPDLMIAAKGLTSGYLPLGAVLVSRRVAEPFWTRGTPFVFRHGYTYSGHASSCAAALVNLDILERERLVERVVELELVLGRVVSALRDHPAVGDVRQIGLLAAIEFDPALVADQPEAPDRAVRAARKHGVLTRLIGGPSLHVSPPFVIDVPALEEIGTVFLRALDSVVASVSRPSESEAV